MFIIELTYTAELDSIDAAMKAHMLWLNSLYAEGRVLVSGRKIPRDGGVIIVKAESRDEVEAIANEDPFVKQRLAAVRIVEFRASQMAPAIKSWV